MICSRRIAPEQVMYRPQMELTPRGSDSWPGSLDTIVRSSCPDPRSGHTKRTRIMKKLTLILTAGAMLAASGAAFAATLTPAQQCTKLEKQFDSVIKKHATDAKAARAEGGDLCKSADKKADGVKKLQEAVTDLGLKPRV